jgi:hypothetical protein
MLFKKNKREFLLLIAVTILRVLPLAAQEVPPPWHIGITAGYTNNELYTSDQNRAFSRYERGHRFEVSVPVRYQFAEWFALQAELQFIQKNYTWTRDKNFDGIYMDVTNSFIDIPVMANFSFGGSKLRGFLNAGGFMGVWINSHRRGTDYGAGSNVWDPQTYYYDYDENIEFDHKRDNLFDAGLLLGLGVQYEWKPVTIFVEGRFNYGLSDLQKDYMYEKVPRINDTIAITIGALFNRNSLDFLRRK